MSAVPNVKWIDTIWNPVTGCTKVSSGCKNCFAEPLSVRLQTSGKRHFSRGFEPIYHPTVLEVPFNWGSSKLIFMAPLSDLFHESVPQEFIQEVLGVIRKVPQHTFMTLTKRSKRLTEIDSILAWPDNLWLGVSVEDSNYSYRVDHLRDIKGVQKFISFEPLLGDFPELNLEGISWVSAGSEYGQNKRNTDINWLRNIQIQCENNEIPYFHHSGGRGLNLKEVEDGIIYDG